MVLVLTRNLDYRKDSKYQWKRRMRRLRMIRRHFRTTYFRHGIGRVVFFMSYGLQQASKKKEENGVKRDFSPSNCL